MEPKQEEGAGFESKMSSTVHAIQNPISDQYYIVRINGERDGIFLAVQ